MPNSIILPQPWPSSLSDLGLSYYGGGKLVHFPDHFR